MDITCPKCSTEYEFDDNSVSETGIAVQCTHCGYTFRVKRKQIVETEDIPTDRYRTKTLPGITTNSGAESSLWTVQTVRGELRQFQELSTLQQWIVEGKVIRDDQISRSGQSWKRLGDIAELSSLFHVVDATKAAQVSRPQLNEVAFGSGPKTLGEYKSASLNEPAFAFGSGGIPKPAKEPSWNTVEKTTIQAEESGSFDLDFYRRRSRRFVLFVVLALVVVVAGGLVAIKPEFMQSVLGPWLGQEPDRNQPFYDKARQLFLLDDEKNLNLADNVWGKVSPPTALSLSGRSEVYTTWSQHLRELADVLDWKSKKLDERAAILRTQSSGTPTQPNSASTPSAAQKIEADMLSEAAKVMRLRAGKLKNEAKQKLALAAPLLQKTSQLDGAKILDAYRAQADWMRSMERPHGDISMLIEKALALNAADAELAYVRGAALLHAGDIAQAKTVMTQAVVKSRAYLSQGLLRAMSHLALIHFREGKLDEAIALYDEILKSNPQHAWAKELKTLLESELALAVSAAPPASPPTGTSTGSTPMPPTKNVAPTEPAEQAPVPEAKPTPVVTPSTEQASSPRSYDSFLALGERLMSQGKTTHAMEAFKGALRLTPKGIEAITGLGYCYLDLNQYASAISHFRRALMVSPTHGDAIVGMAESYKATGNKRRALDYYKEYLLKLPTGPKAEMARQNIEQIERDIGSVAPTPSTTSGASPAETPSTETPSPDSASPSGTSTTSPPASNTPEQIPEPPSIPQPTTQPTTN